jgi:hypothetical protein
MRCDKSLKTQIPIERKEREERDKGRKNRPLKRTSKKLSRHASEILSKLFM